MIHQTQKRNEECDGRWKKAAEYDEIWNTRVKSEGETGNSAEQTNL